jgi:hypothetical protein
MLSVLPLMGISITFMFKVKSPPAALPCRHTNCKATLTSCRLFVPSITLASERISC